MTIEECVVKAPFRHFWMKTVVDVNLNQHCINCLIGERDSRITPKQLFYENVELKNSVYYLCGVVYPFDWASNFHLAFRPCVGKTLEEVQNGVSILIRDAEKLPISQDFIDPDDPHFGDKSYYTCRNWQFAHWFYKKYISLF